MSRRILIRIIIALAGFWIILLCLIYISGEKYRDHAISILRAQLDEYLLTEIHVRKNNIHVSLIKKFPYAVVDLEDILIKSSPDFTRSDFQNPNSDTLLFASTISLMFNLKSLFTKTYVLKKIEIQDAKLNILGDTKGRFNYNILRKNRTNELQDTINFDLNDIRIRNLLFNYNIRKSDVRITGKIQKAQLSGSFSESEFHLNSRFEVRNTSIEVEGKNLIADEDFSLKCDLQEKESVYIFSKGDLTLFGIHMNAEGTYNSTKSDYNFSLACTSALFQKLDNNLVNRYLGDLDLKPTGGNMDIRFQISGRNPVPPLIKLSFLINNGVIKHRESRIKAENVFIKGFYTNGQQRKANSNHLQLDSLFLKSGSTEIYLSGSIDNFMSPSIKGNIRGNLELSKLSIFKSVEEKIEMKGNISMNVTIDGTLPQVKNLKTKDIRKINLQGILLLDEASFNMKNRAIPSSTVSGRISLKNLSEIYLENIHVNTGVSDLQLKGSVTNLPFFTSDHSQFPIYRCSVISNEFHMEDFLMTPDGESDSMQVLFPDSMIVYADFTVKSFAFGKFQANGVSGTLSYQPKTIEIKDFVMQSQGGTIQSDISFTQLERTITSNSEANFQHVDIRDLFYAFNDFGQSVLTHEYIDGALTGYADVTAVWDLHLNPLYDKLTIRSDFIIEKGELVNYQPLLGLSDYIQVEELKHIKFDDLHADVWVADRKVVIEQTQINSSAISLLASGEHDFENRYAYRIQVHLADVLWKKAKKKKNLDTEFGYIVDDEHQRTILPLIITGKDTIFKVSYDKKTGGSIFRDRIIQEKQEWKELVYPDPSTNSDKQNFKVEWNEEDDSPVNTSPNDNDNADEFHIEWDDE